MLRALFWFLFLPDLCLIVSVISPHSCFHILFHMLILCCATVQHACIPQAVLGQDVICQAKSGMGKTAVFVLSVLQQITPVDKQVSSLILCHTRELAYQVRDRSFFSRLFRC